MPRSRSKGRISHSFLRSTCALATSLALTLPAFAQPASPPPAAPETPEAPAAKPDYKKAAAHYRKAEELAASEEWAGAAKEYGIAYDITKDPVLFFKLGNAYQLSGDCTRAVEYFKRYLAEGKPSEEFRSDTEARISGCQSAIDTGNAAEVEEVDDEAPPELGDNPLAPSIADTKLSDDESVARKQPSFIEEEVTWQRTAGWTSVGLTVAFLSATAVLSLSANSREEDLDNLLRYTDAEGRPSEFDGTIAERYDSLREEGDELNRMSLIALGLAGVTATSAVVFFLLDDTPDEEEGFSGLAPSVSGDAYSVSASWNF